MKYEVAYTTLSRRCVEVEADSLNHALERVQDMLRNNPGTVDKEARITTEDRKIVSVWMQDTS